MSEERTPELTAERIAEIRKREQEATPPPWVWYEPRIEGGKITGFFTPVDGIWVWQGHDPPVEMLVEDAEFIAHARTDVGDLLAEIDRQRAENERLRTTIEGKVWEPTLAAALRDLLVEAKDLAALAHDQFCSVAHSADACESSTAITEARALLDRLSPQEPAKAAGPES